MNHSDSYTRAATNLHWLIAIAIIITFGVSFYMHDLPLTPQWLANEFGQGIPDSVFLDATAARLTREERS